MLFRHIPASVFAPQANQLLQAPQPTRAPKSKPSTPVPMPNKGNGDGSAATPTKVISFEPGMSAKSYIEEFFMLVPQKTGESDSTTKEYAGINGQALRQQALTIIQNFISNILDACMADDSRTNIRTLRTMIQKSCKILSILSRYQTPSSPQDYFSGPWLDKMRLACYKVCICFRTKSSHKRTNRPGVKLTYRSCLQFLSRIDGRLCHDRRITDNNCGVGSGSKGR